MSIRLNVYYCALLEADDMTPHCDMLCALCSEEVRERIRLSFRQPRYITIRRVPELKGLMDPETGETEIALK